MISICSEQEASENTIARIATECVQILSSAILARRELKVVTSALEREDSCRRMVVELRALVQGQRETIAKLRRRPSMTSSCTITDEDPVMLRAEELQRQLEEQQERERALRDRVSALEDETLRLKEIAKQSVYLLEAKQVSAER